MVFIVLIVLLNTFLNNKQSATTPSELFESKQLSYTDYEYDIPHRKYIPLNEIAVLPMDDYMVLYLRYVCDSEYTDDIQVAFRPMKVINDLYYSLPDSSLIEAEKFENQSTGSYESGFHSLNYTIIPANSPEIENYDPKVYNFVNARYTDSKGIKQDVVFCYTYKIYWKLGDGSVPDKF